MVGSSDAYPRVVELAIVHYVAALYSTLSGRHKGRHTVMVGVY